MKHDWILALILVASIAVATIPYTGLQPLGLFMSGGTIGYALAMGQYRRKKFGE